MMLVLCTQYAFQKLLILEENALGETEYPKNALVVTTVPPALSDKWLARMGIQDYMLYDQGKT